MVVTREALYAEVWAEPMLKVAERYKVSSSYMARVCTVMNVPRPAAGYWAKVAVGKSPPVPRLPVAQPTDQLEWIPGTGLNLVVRAPVPRRSRLPESRTMEAPSDPKPVGMHRMLVGVEAILRAAPETDGYLKPSKRLMLDVLTSKQCLSHCLGTAKALVDGLEEHGHAVMFAPSPQTPRVEIDEREVPDDRARYPTRWRPSRATVAQFGSILIGLALFEMSTEVEVAYVKDRYLPISVVKGMRNGPQILARTWTSKRNIPSKRLRLVAYAPYYDVAWRKSWLETEDRPLTQDVEKIIRQIERSVPEIKQLMAEAEQRQIVRRAEFEAQQRKWEEESRRRKQKELREKCIAELSEIFTNWEYERRVGAFLADMRERILQSDKTCAADLEHKIELAAELLYPPESAARFHSWNPPEPIGESES